MEFKLVEIGGHTIAPELLSDGIIIDVGCRFFTFANYFADKPVYCIDPDPKVFEGAPTCFINMCVAISDKSGESAYYENGEATCLKQIDPDQNHQFQPCKTITMDDLYQITGTNIDVLKLDCEGAEYIILGETFKPIPKQITVEYHAHTVPDLHWANIKSISNRLAENYIVANGMNWERRHGCTENFWDVLYIRKDLIK